MKDINQVLDRLYGSPVDFPTRYRVAASLDFSVRLTNKLGTSIWTFNN